MSDRSRYIMPVKEVKNHLNRKVNLIAVVVEFSVPRMSEGTDYCTILKVIDQSQQSPELSVNVFIDDIHQLPHICSHKDIIFLSSVRIETHNQEFYAVFNKSFSSFALFDGNCSSDFSPYQTSPSFCLLDSDKRFITRLRNWCLNFQLDAVPNLLTDSKFSFSLSIHSDFDCEFCIATSLVFYLMLFSYHRRNLAGMLCQKRISEYLVSFKDIKEREFVDLVCKVLGVCEVSSNEWVIFLWDGTDVPLISLNSKVEEQNLIQLQIESVPLPMDVLGKFPAVGTVLRVIADQSYGKLGNHFPYVGNWVRIRNLLCETDSGLWKGFLSSKSKVRLLSENDNNVVEHKRKIKERLSLWGRVPMSSYRISNFLTVLTVRGCETTKFATLMDLLTFPKDEGILKCVVRIVAICPHQAKDFQSPAGEYRIRMTLEDPTARIHALLCAEDAETFFGGHQSVSELAAKMNKLLGLPEADDSPRNPPWIQCCIEVRSSGEEGTSANRHYHIRFTRIVV